VNLPVFSDLPPQTHCPISSRCGANWSWHCKPGLQRCQNEEGPASDLDGPSPGGAWGQWEAVGCSNCLQSNVAECQSDFPVIRIWQANMAGRTPTDSKDPFDLDEGSVNLFIWNDGLNPGLTLEP